jgi:hypothetical protein
VALGNDPLDAAMLGPDEGLGDPVGEDVLGGEERRLKEMGRRFYFAFSRSNVTRIISLPGAEENPVGRSLPGGAKHILRVVSPSS